MFSLELIKLSRKKFSIFVTPIILVVDKEKGIIGLCFLDLISSFLMKQDRASCLAEWVGGKDLGK